ncbi:hypothetical protein MMC08_008261 [Hypocenomyce scalaris]|nr:hypothetical protein [Hypocenomyce scalaris]
MITPINIKASETVIVAPATGSFGGAAVSVALAMSARVIAMGRNLDALTKLAARGARISPVQITGDTQSDAETLQILGQIDAYFDISPPAAAQSTHIKKRHPRAPSFGPREPHGRHPGRYIHPPFRGHAQDSAAQGEADV